MNILKEAQRHIRQALILAAALSGGIDKSGQPLNVEKIVKDNLSGLTAGQCELLESCIDVLCFQKEFGVSLTNQHEGEKLYRLPFRASDGEDRCLLCRVSDNKLHRPGCISESCPSCGNSLILCGCRAISLSDGLIVKGVMEKGRTWRMASPARGPEKMAAETAKYLSERD